MALCDQPFIIVILLSILLLVVQCCPLSCRCLETNTTLAMDCSNIGITEIPILSPNVTRLLLNDNKIQSIEEIKKLQLSRLEYLDLSNNPIEHIQPFNFNGTTSLKKLIITTDEIVEYSFDGLKLETFSLIGGNVKTLPPSLLRSSRNSLKALTIQDTKVEKVEFLRLRFQNLETLVLTGNCLTYFDFDSLPEALKNVNLSRNKLQQFECFDAFENVIYFDVSFNQLKNIPQYFPRCFPYLTDVRVQHNVLSTLQKGFFSELRNSLESIDLSFNPWTSLPTKELGVMLNLKELKLQSMNELDLDLSPIEVWKNGGDKGLRLLDLSYNSRLKSYKIPLNTRIGKLVFTDSSLKTFPIMSQQHGIINWIEVQRNHIEELIITRSIKHLNASHNRIRFINISYIWTEIDVLDVGHNRIESTHDIHIGSNTYLGYVNLTFNKLKRIDSFYEAPPDIRGKFGFQIHPIRMDFSYNSVSVVNRSAFFGVQPMVAVKLNSNNLTSLPDDVFVQQRHLNKLDLNHNNLQKVPTNLLRTVKYLSYLLLADNQIREISSTDFKGLYTLNSLDLSSNSYLSELPAGFLSKKKHLRRLSIFNTSIVCTCNLTTILNNIIMRTNGRIKYDGTCLDKSTGNSQSLKTIVKTSEANPWLCNNDCPTLKCVLQKQCFQRANTSITFNCSCEHSFFNNTSSNNTFSFPIYGNPPWTTPTRESSFSRNLIFCQTQSCDLFSQNSTVNSTEMKRPAFRHPQGRCKWSLTQQNDVQTGNLIECSNIPLLTKIFCRLDDNKQLTTVSPPIKNDHKTTFSPTAKIIVGLSVGALFFVGVVVFFGRKWKSHRSVDLLADTYVLTDFDYLDDVTIESNEV